MRHGPSRPWPRFGRGPFVWADTVTLSGSIISPGNRGWGWKGATLVVPTRRKPSKRRPWPRVEIAETKNRNLDYMMTVYSSPYPTYIHPHYAFFGLLAEPLTRISTSAIETRYGPSTAKYAAGCGGGVADVNSMKW